MTADRLEVASRHFPAGQHGRRVARVDPRQLEVLHDPPPEPAGDDVPCAANIEISRLVLVDLHFGHASVVSPPNAFESVPISTSTLPFNSK